MYFWRTDLLVDEVRSDSLDESTRKNYYLATAIVGTVIYYMASANPRADMVTLVGEGIGTFVITVLGISFAFNANGGASGSRFLERIVVLSFPLLVKTLAASFVLGAVGGIAMSIYQGLSSGEVFSVGSLIISAVYFWRLSYHIKRSNAL